MPRRTNKDLLGRKFSDVSKEKMRQAKLGKVLSDDHRRKIGDSILKIPKEERARKISFGMKKTARFQLQNEVLSGMVCENKSYGEDEHLQHDKVIASVLKEFGVGKRDQHLIWSLDVPLTDSILDTVIAEGTYAFCDNAVPGSGFVSEKVSNPTYRNLIFYANQRIVECLDFVSPTDLWKFNPEIPNYETAQK